MGRLCLPWWPMPSDHASYHRPVAMTHEPAGRSGPGTAVPGPATRPVDGTPATAASPDERWLRAARYARWLAWTSLAWMAAEGILGLLAGLAAGSIALVGWALGSAIEALARSSPQADWSTRLTRW